MTIPEIREIGINSAEAYYNFLNQNDKGIQELDVIELEYIHKTDMLLKIRIAGKIVDTEALFFKNLRNGKRYDTIAVKVVEYDTDKNFLLIKPGEKVKPAFESLRHSDLKVISDLKFLVVRVKSWFKMNGAKIELPSLPSKYAESVDNITFFEEKHLQPSENQKEAIKTVFTNPFTYVWGAPGTGKTQFVLAYAILHYIKNGDKVAIIAPTNNALEQVLRAVIKMTDKAGVKRSKILRLGSPSKNFVEMFPEVCEDQGITKNLTDFDNQIDILKRVQDFNETWEMYDQIKNLPPLFDELIELSKTMKSDKKERIKIHKKAEPIIDSIKQKFVQFPEWEMLMDELSLFNCKMVHKQLVTSIQMIEKQLETDEPLFKEYMNTSWDILEAQIEALQIKRNHIAANTTEARLRLVNLVACTIDGYIGRYTDTKLIVDHLFLDEAGYANIAKTLTLFNRSTPITFFGDHKQLPPVCEINDFDIEKEEQYHSVFLWGQSSIFLDTLFRFERDVCRDQYLKNAPYTPFYMVQASLDATYRFGDNLARLLARYVYTPSFHSLNPNGETQIHFIHAKKVDELRSRCSINEVLEIKSLIISLKKQGNTDYIVLTPYKNQVKLLGKNMPQERNEYKFLTVHGSQGREWDTVILSVVDTFDKWFVDTQRPISKGMHLINTAVSRARKNLIIVCDLDYWGIQQGQMITELYKISKK
jgi:hypothetical protein